MTWLEFIYASVCMKCSNSLLRPLLLLLLHSFIRGRAEEVSGLLAAHRGLDAKQLTAVVEKASNATEMASEFSFANCIAIFCCCCCCCTGIISCSRRC